MNLKTHFNSLRNSIKEMNQSFLERDPFYMRVIVLIFGYRKKGYRRKFVDARDTALKLIDMTESEITNYVFSKEFNKPVENESTIMVYFDVEMLIGLINICNAYITVMDLETPASQDLYRKLIDTINRGQGVVNSIQERIPGAGIWHMKILDTALLNDLLQLVHRYDAGEFVTDKKHVNFFTDRKAIIQKAERAYMYLSAADGLILK